jgi:hypothetical protein
MKIGIKTAVCALLATGAVALSASTAAAAIVCNAEGACWHVPHPEPYIGRPGIFVHPNGWRWAPGAHYVWREHPGRGFWRGGVWVVF